MNIADALTKLLDRDFAVVQFPNRRDPIYGDFFGSQSKAIADCVSSPDPALEQEVVMKDQGHETLLLAISPDAVVETEHPLAKVYTRDVIVFADAVAEIQRQHFIRAERDGPVYDLTEFRGGYLSTFAEWLNDMPVQEAIAWAMAGFDRKHVVLRAKSLDFTPETAAEVVNRLADAILPRFADDRAKKLPPVRAVCERGRVEPWVWMSPDNFAKHKGIAVADCERWANAGLVRLLRIEGLTTRWEHADCEAPFFAWYETWQQQTPLQKVVSSARRSWWRWFVPWG